jgi:hypothetical protein
MALLTDVSAVLVTSGDVDLTTILASLAFLDDVVVWDNSREPEDMVCYGRHLAAERAKHDIIYTQDDDALCPAAALIQAYRGTMLVNVPIEEAPLTAWGAVYSKQSVIDAFDLYLAHYPLDRDVKVCADVIHTALTPWERLHFGHLDFPYFNAPHRMHRLPGHYEDRLRVAEQARALADPACGPVWKDGILLHDTLHRR